MSMLFNVLATTKYSVAAIFTNNSNPSAGTISNGGLTVSGGGITLFSSDLLDQDILDGGVYGYDFTMDVSSFGNSNAAYVGFSDVTEVVGATDGIALYLLSDGVGAITYRFYSFADGELSSPITISDPTNRLTLVTSTTGGVTNIKLYEMTTLRGDFNFSYTFDPITRLACYLPGIPTFSATLETGPLLIGGVTRVTVPV